MPRDLSHAPDRHTPDPGRLNRRFQGNTAGALAHVMGGALGPVALVSSFGAESAVLLHMAAQIDRHLPVLFIDTQLLFPETLAYHETLVARLGLSDVRRLGPDRTEAFVQDPDLALHGADADACCALRKARPLARALAPFGGWITGRKRFQGGQRAGLAMFEREPGAERIKINPLAGSTAAELRAYMARHGLPPHPLAARGYPSIGCMPCTSAVQPGEGARAGRWRGQAKTECGIHLVGGRPVRGATA